MAKHCTHVAISWMSFLDWVRSEALSSTTWPSIPWVKDDKGLLRPFAGGSSPRSTYAPERKNATVDRLSGGVPGTTMIVPGVATEVTRDMSGLATIDGELIVPVAGQSVDTQ